MRWMGHLRRGRKEAARPRRLMLELTGTAARALDDLARRSGRTPAEILGEGLVLRKLAASAEAHDRRLAILERDGSVRERIALG